MNQKLLLCCDLDRTLLPNGPQDESPNARRLFLELANLPEVVLAYVSGRDLVLLQEAIADFGLPLPQYAVGDVGSTVYHIDNDQWESLQARWATVSAQAPVGVIQMRSPSRTEALPLWESFSPYCRSQR